MWAQVYGVDQHSLQGEQFPGLVAGTRRGFLFTTMKSSPAQFFYILFHAVEKDIIGTAFTALNLRQYLTNAFDLKRPQSQDIQDRLCINSLYLKKQFTEISWFLGMGTWWFGGQFKNHPEHRSWEAKKITYLYLFDFIFYFSFLICYTAKQHQSCTFNRMYIQYKIYTTK